MHFQMLVEVGSGVIRLASLSQELMWQEGGIVLRAVTGPHKAPRPQRGADWVFLSWGHYSSF